MRVPCNRLELRLHPSDTEQRGTEHYAIQTESYVENLRPTLLIRIFGFQFNDSYGFTLNQTDRNVPINLYFLCFHLHHLTVSLTFHHP